MSSESIDRYIQVGYRKVDLDSTLYIACGILLVVVYLWRNITDERPLPPGPTPLPVIGNLLQIPRRAPWETFHQWTAKYGPIMSFRAGSHTVIVLGTREAVNDLLVKRSTRYASRPRLILMRDYLLRGLPGLEPHSKDWAQRSRVKSKLLGQSLTKRHSQAHEVAAKQLLLNIGSEMDTDLTVQLNVFTATGISWVLYGWDVGAFSAERHQRVQGMTHRVINGLCIQNGLVELFPVLEYIPGALAGAKRMGEEMRRNIEEVIEPRMHAALQHPDWNLVREMSAHWPGGVNDVAFRMSVLEMEIGAIHTTTAMIGTVVVMAALHPREMEVVYAEMDRVVGNARVPTFADTDRLPYLKAFASESYRVNTMAPLVPPRCPLEEDEYMGFRIPTDAWIVVNQWGLNMDAALFPDPTLFMPERWIQNPNLAPPAVFGFGKRSCPAKLVAGNAALLAVASLVWAFRFHPKEGLSEKADSTATLMFIPQTSRVGVSYRTPQHKETIERARTGGDLLSHGDWAI